MDVLVLLLSYMTVQEETFFLKGSQCVCWLALGSPFIVRLATDLKPDCIFALAAAL